MTSQWNQETKIHETEAHEEAKISRKQETETIAQLNIQDILIVEKQRPKILPVKGQW